MYNNMLCVISSRCRILYLTPFPALPRYLFLLMAGGGKIKKTKNEIVYFYPYKSTWIQNY